MRINNYNVIRLFNKAKTYPPLVIYTDRILSLTIITTQLI